MSCLILIWNHRHPESTYNTLFIIVPHLNSSAVVRQCIPHYPYCDLIFLIYEVIITMIIYIEISSIIEFLVLSHTSNNYVYTFIHYTTVVNIHWLTDNFNGCLKSFRKLTIYNATDHMIKIYISCLHRTVTKEKISFRTAVKNCCISGSFIYL